MPLLIDTECDDCRSWYRASADANYAIEATYGRLLCADCCFHATPREAA